MTHLRTLPNGMAVHTLNRNETDYLYKEIFEDEGYLPAEGLGLPDRPVIVDVGANIGMFSLFAAQRWPGARVFSFEPVPRTFEALSRNIAALPGVTAFNLALGSAPEIRQLTHYPQYTMMSGFDADPAEDKALVRSYIENVAAGLDDPLRREVFVEEADELLEGRFEDVELVACQVDRLDAVAARLGIDRIDFLKVDVEGFELAVLQGIGDRLWPGIRNAAVEVEGGPAELARIDELFTRHGMRTAVDQPAEYRGTEVYTLFATRTA
ncbi:FkbM family methyltransferase [Kitasatospora terrestris]|uniref:Methyltransferase FkbM domain-containing protein n=1 Tax=Kitasatospora terrestris TaxID=258051 RepID=A0ABP9DAZ9_9ACTN